jgi:hypothetical protein
MNKKEQHLTEQELIEYQFKLASDDRTKEIAQHLESCNQCQEQLEKLKRKFASLDLLHDEVKVSEDLISKAVQQARKPIKAKIFSLTKSAWLSAAAVVLIGALLLISLPGTDTKQEASQDIDAVKELKSETIERGLAEETTKEPATTSGRRDISEKTFAYTPPAKDESPQPVLGFATESEAIEKPSEFKEDITEQPPFAPASSIELVTLPRRENVQLTIYNSADLTLVREKRNLVLKRGWNWLQFMWANTLIDPTSLSLEPLEQKGQIDIQALVFPARLRQIGRWLIRSEFSGQVPFEITYLTSGLSWRAFYMGTLSEDEKSMQMKGYVRVSNNSGEDYENAQTRLIVGQVHMLDEIAELARRQYPYGSPLPIIEGQKSNVLFFDKEEENRLGKVPMLAEMPMVGAWYKIPERKEIIKEGLSEYFLYTIEGTETIENQWSKRLLSFEADDIEVESLYKYDESRYGNQTIRFVKFTNDEEHNLGETPIPDGNVKIYGVTSQQGYLSYVGGTNVKYIPVNEEVELNLGPARLVEVKPTLMDLKTDNYIFDPNNNIIGWDEIRTWKIEIINTRTLPVSIEITRDFGTNFWTMQSETPYEEHDVTRIRFNLGIEPRAKREIEYTVTTYHGTQQDQFDQ